MCASKMHLALLNLDNNQFICCHRLLEYPLHIFYNSYDVIMLHTKQSTQEKCNFTDVNLYKTVCLLKFYQYDEQKKLMYKTSFVKVMY